ncbi:MAG TPA: DUF1232 domain-containing protein [Rhodothermales bacterium]|nr:DUF1232 domain-containing protein [Rhodothermales bacterium]
MFQHRKQTKEYAWSLWRLLRSAASVEHKVAVLLEGSDLAVMMRLLRAYASGTYRDVPWRLITAASCGTLYLVNPLDAVADVLPLLGFTDDAAVLSTILTALSKDLDRFREWEGKL